MSGWTGSVQRTSQGTGQQTEVVDVVVLRTLLGDALRERRLRQHRTLREVSGDARVSLGYLSEVERGQKEASSELLASICRALGVRLSDVLREVSDELAVLEPHPVPVLEAVPEPALAPAGSRGATVRTVTDVAA
jgi:transcriptional regulator with XRE-family HTH domain